MREVIMVCFGNVCRSPMAEALLQRALDEQLGDGAVLVTSGGVGASDGYPPSQGTIRAMADRGIDVRRHRSRELTPSWASRAFLIYCMEDYQVDRVRAMAPSLDGRARLMGGEEVPDPLGSGQGAYDAVAEQLERLLPLVVDEVLSEIEADVGRG